MLSVKKNCPKNKFDPLCFINDQVLTRWIRVVSNEQDKSMWFHIY